jgi:hypothetical protein
MRWVAAALGLLVLVVLPGCSGSKWGFLRHNDASAPQALPTERPTSAQLVAYLNHNAELVQSLQCSDVDIDFKQGILNQFGAQASLTCAKPRNFRMVAMAVGKTQVDVGSNQDEFWFWAAKGDPPYLIHCTYRDLANGVQVPFPFQPEWVMEALGMASYDPAKNYQMQVRDSNYELIENTVNSQGQQVQKVTVFNQGRSQVQVRAHILRNAQGREVCAAHITEVQAFSNGAVMPRRVVLEYPSEKLTLKLKLWDNANDVKLNQPFRPEDEARMFTRPTLNGVQSYDLATRSLDGAGAPLRQAGGFLQR